MISEWETFFSAILSVTGVLLGLLFVGISLNISKITSSEKLLKASRQPLFLLLGLLIISIFFLIPGQSFYTLGTEITVSGLILGLTMFNNDYSILKKTDKSLRKNYISNVAVNLLPAALIVVSGVMMLLQEKAGIYMMIPAVIWSFIQIATMSWAFVIINVKHEDRDWYNSDDIKK